MPNSLWDKSFLWEVTPHLGLTGEAARLTPSKGKEDCLATSIQAALHRGQRGTQHDKPKGAISTDVTPHGNFKAWTAKW